MWAFYQTSILLRRVLKGWGVESSANDRTLQGVLRFFPTLWTQPGLPSLRVLGSVDIDRSRFGPFDSTHPTQRLRRSGAHANGSVFISQSALSQQVDWANLCRPQFAWATKLHPVQHHRLRQYPGSNDGRRSRSSLAKEMEHPRNCALKDLDCTPSPDQTGEQRTAKNSFFFLHVTAQTDQVSSLLAKQTTYYCWTCRPLHRQTNAPVYASVRFQNPQTDAADSVRRVGRRWTRRSDRSDEFGRNSSL